MKNNKAFTLVELLAVVTILTILALIITPMIDSNIKKAKEKTRRMQIENIRMAVQAYYADNIDERPDTNSWTKISYSDLLGSGYIRDDEKLRNSGLSFTKVSEFEIKNVNGKYSYIICDIEECDNE